MSKKFVNTLKAAETYTHTHTHTCSFLPSLKQIGTICFLTIISISPSYSYITNASNCNQGVLQTDTGPAALEANYSANRINTTWYSDGTAIQGAPSYCMYDSAISLPSAQTKPGYAFGGWRVHVAPVVPVSPFASLNTTTDGTNSSYSNDSMFPTGSYSVYNAAIDDFDYYDYPSLAFGTWTVTFPYGTISGIAQCKDAQGGTEEQSEGDGEYEGEYFGLNYCYCQIMSYTPSGGTSQTDSTLPSVYTGVWIEPVQQGYGNYLENGCLRGGTRSDTYESSSGCASICAEKVRYSSSFRAQLFGQSQ